MRDPDPIAARVPDLQPPDHRAVGFVQLDRLPEQDDLPLPGDQVEASWSDDACVLLPGSPENAPATDPDAVPANLEPTSLEEEPVK